MPPSLRDRASAAARTRLEPALPPHEAGADTWDEERRRRRRAAGERAPASGAEHAACTAGAAARPAPKTREAPQAAQARVPAAAGVQLERPARSRPALRLARVLPIVLILLALLVALYVSGVFGGNDPASSPSVSVPADSPGATTTPQVVAVPGAKDASADAVETAKARARGEGHSGGEEEEAGDEDRRLDAGHAAGGRLATAGRVPPASGQSGRRAPTTPSREPAPQRDTGGDDEKQIDAGSGATGAEQIPPAADPSGVPDLAPPPETATP